MMPDFMTCELARLRIPFVGLQTTPTGLMFHETGQPLLRKEGRKAKVKSNYLTNLA